MKRRSFVAGLAASLGLPQMAFAQTGAIPEVVLFYTGPMASAELRAKLIREDLAASGFVEGKDYKLSLSVAGKNDDLPRLASALVHPGVAVVLAVGPAALRAAEATSSMVPIVALDLETDPVKTGLARSLARPGGNVTGLFFDFPEFSGKLLELLTEARPGLSRVAALWDPASGPVQLEAAKASAAARNIRLQVVEVGDLSRLAEAFAAAEGEQRRACWCCPRRCSARSAAFSRLQNLPPRIGLRGYRCFPSLPKR